MSNARGNNYFMMMEEMVECSCRAARLLREIMHDFNVAEVGENMKMLHTIEHEGDEMKHKLVRNLVKEFITPIEREDIMAIVNQIDDVTDAVEDVLLKIYMFNVQSINADAISFMDIINSCCDKLLEAFKDFGNFKKTNTIHNAIIEINRLEELGDDLYISAVRSLYITNGNAKEVSAWMEIYNCLEKVCDTCEHTADLVEDVIMKNT